MERVIKGFGVLLAAAAIVGGATALSGASETASVTVPIQSSVQSTKSDRLDIRAVGRDCSQLAWPYYEANCVKDRRQAMSQARDVRIVTADRPSKVSINR
jgi:hypothetical protein